MAACSALLLLSILVTASVLYLELFTVDWLTLNARDISLRVDARPLEPCWYWVAMGNTVAGVATLAWLRRAPATITAS
ncbi:hypothetical protein ACN469_02745 [Corallococcus terminator]